MRSRIPPNDLEPRGPQETGLPLAVWLHGWPGRLPDLPSQNSFVTLWAKDATFADHLGHIQHALFSTFPAGQVSSNEEEEKAASIVISFSVWLLLLLTVKLLTSQCKKGTSLGQFRCLCLRKWLCVTKYEAYFLSG